MLLLGLSKYKGSYEKQLTSGLISSKEQNYAKPPDSRQSYQLHLHVTNHLADEVQAGKRKSPSSIQHLKAHL